MSDRPIDQLDMQCRMALLETRRDFTDARNRARRWQPAPYRAVNATEGGTQ